MDLLQMMREQEQALQGIAPEQREVLQALAKSRPDCKFIVPTPGTESKLNGVSTADISKLVVNMPAGQELSKRELVEGLGGNPKSSRDVGKVTKILPDVPEIEMKPGVRGVLLRRLNGPSQA